VRLPREAVAEGDGHVRAFNSVNYKVLASEAHRSGEKLGMMIAGDDKRAVEASLAWFGTPVSSRSWSARFEMQIASMWIRRSSHAAGPAGVRMPPGSNWFA
jgi:hypothetical protein